MKSLDNKNNFNYFLIIFLFYLIKSGFCELYAQQVPLWEIVKENPDTNFSNVTMQYMKPVNADTQNFLVIAYGPAIYYGILKSTDAGTNWTLIKKDFPIPYYRIKYNGLKYPTKDLIILLADSLFTIGTDEHGNDTIVYKTFVSRSTDGGITWQKINIDTAWQTVGSSSKANDFADSLNGVFVHYNDGSDSTDKIYHTNDGGLNWKIIPSPSKVFASDYIKMVDVNSILLKNYEGFYRTTNLGVEWEKYDIPPEMKVNGNPMRGLKFKDINNGWAVGSRKDNNGFFHSVIHKTEDGGKSWAKMLDSEIGILNILVSIDFVGDSNLIAVGNSNIYTSSDGGNSWQFQLSPPIFNRWINITWVMMSDSDLAIASNECIIRFAHKTNLLEPTFTKPDPSDTDLPLYFDLEWTPIEGAEHYHLQVIEQKAIRDPMRPPPNFDSVLYVNDSLITENRYKIPDIKLDKNYACRIRATNSTQQSQWTTEEFFTTEDTTGIEENFETEQIEITPNPVENICKIKLGSGFNSMFSEIKIFNTFGQEISGIVKKEIENNSKIQLDVSCLNNGVYFAVINSNGTVRTMPFVIFK